jgi:hypothetical protein
VQFVVGKSIDYNRCSLPRPDLTLRSKRMRFSALDPVKDAEQSMADFDLAASVGKHKIVLYVTTRVADLYSFYTDPGF